MLDNPTLRIIDWSIPATPTLVGFTSTVASPREVTVLGTRAYVAGGHHSLDIIDVSNQAAPVRLGLSSPSAAASALGVAVSGTSAYLADDYALRAINISTPALLTETKRYTMPLNTG